MSVTIALPGLIWPDSGDIEYLYPEIKTPLLDQFLKKSKIIQHSYSYSDFLCGIHLVEPHLKQFCENNNSISVKLAKQLDIHNEFPYFLVAEPTHLRIDRDRLLISESSLLQLDESEAHSIIDKINSHFAPDFKLYYIHENLWLLGLNIDPSGEDFYPILDIIGENINDYLPKSKNSILYNKFLNEVQMLLFDSEINKIRKTEGSLSISSLWLWDKPFAKNRFAYDEVYINDDQPLLNCDKIQTLPDNLEQILISDKNILVIVGSLYYPSAYRDSYAWLNQLEILESLVFEPLSRLKDFTLLISGSNKTLEVRIKKQLFFNIFSKNNLINLARIWHAS